MLMLFLLPAGTSYEKNILLLYFYIIFVYVYFLMGAAPQRPLLTGRH